MQQHALHHWSFITLYKFDAHTTVGPPCVPQKIRKSDACAAQLLWQLLVSWQLLATNQSNHRRLHSTHAGCQASMQGLCTSSGSGTARCMHMLPPLQGDATPSTRSCFPASCNRCVACSMQPHCYACCAACCSLRASTRPQAAVMLRLISSTMTAGLAVQMTPQCFQEHPSAVACWQRPKPNHRP